MSASMSAWTQRPPTESAKKPHIPYEGGESIRRIVAETGYGITRVRGLLKRGAVHFESGVAPTRAAAQQSTFPVQVDFGVANTNVGQSSVARQEEDPVRRRTRSGVER